MSTPVTYVGNQYSIPAYGDAGYAQGAGNLSSYLVALATGSLTLSGGSFPLTADANFGTNFGLVALYLKSTTSNVASSGVIRLAKTDVISWRNNANDGNLPLAIDSSNNLTYNGTIITSASGDLTGPFITLTNTTNQIIMGTTNTTTISSVAPSASRVYTIPDAGSAANFILSAGAQTITGAKTFADQTLLLQETGSTDVITINVASLAASRAYTMPDAGGAASFVMNAGDSTIAGTKTFSSAPVVPGLNSTFVGLGRNRIMNGDMVVDQRNGGASVSRSSAAWVYDLDRWTSYGQATDGVFTVQQVSSTPPTGFIYYRRHTVTTQDASVGATQLYLSSQRVEGYNMRDFLMGSANAVTFTLSFWVRSSLTGTFGGSFLNSASNRSYVFAYTINSANTWEQKTISLTGDTTGTWLTTNGVGMYIIWDLGSGSNFEGTVNTWAGAANYRASGQTRFIETNAATLDFTGVQLERGSTATNFEFTPYPMLLTQCQRYYERTDSNGATGAVFGTQRSTTTIDMGWIFKVPKRVAPTTVTYTSPTIVIPGTASGLTVSSPTTNASSSNGIQIIGTISAAGATGTTVFLDGGSITADSEL